MTPTDTLKFMNQGNTGQSCKRSLVYKWHGRFSNGREDINDDKRAGRPVTSDSLKLAVASELSTDRRRSIHELADMFDLWHGTMHKIITNDLGMRKVSARSVPRLLSENEKNLRVETSQCFLARHAREGLRRDLVHAIQKKRPDVEIENLIFHQDNARAHRAQETLMMIDFLGFERLNHSPYSPEPAPMDFAIFPRLKADLRGRRFECLAEFRSAVQSSFASLSET
ncbi:histone-lysine N-methyltransferase SETMAR-like [Mya arenaria]|uniref:histone-lysine N-methyltransferase SETMAR-like n=1 Tax=Mya arenaria TaxID=6604 RepID=UPI0022E0A2F8|nr:histone-lysine N-methyltransferase SETMAR-like [Mya arenaria]